METSLGREYQVLGWSGCTPGQHRGCRVRSRARAEPFRGHPRARHAAGSQDAAQVWSGAVGEHGLRGRAYRLRAASKADSARRACLWRARGVQANRDCVALALARELADVGGCWPDSSGPLHSRRRQPLRHGRSGPVARGDAARSRQEQPSPTRSTDPFRQPAPLEQGRFHDGSMHAGHQPTQAV